MFIINLLFNIKIMDSEQLIIVTSGDKYHTERGGAGRRGSFSLKQCVNFCDCDGVQLLMFGELSHAKS